MRITHERTQVVLEYLMEHHYASICHHYGERGYSDPKSGIILCNWNNVGGKRGKRRAGFIDDYLREAGFECEWDDEWVIDYDNDKAYRISGNSWGWQMQVFFTEHGGLITPDDGIDAWLEELSMTREDHTPQCLPSAVFSSADLIMAGFEQYPETGAAAYETGWHPGQTDNPKDVAKEIFKWHGPDVEVIFLLTESSQFYSRWEAWYRKEKPEDE